MRSRTSTLDPVMIVLAGLSLATLGGLLGVLGPVPWLAAGSVAAPVLLMGLLLSLSRRTSSQNPVIELPAQRVMSANTPFMQSIGSTFCATPASDGQPGCLELQVRENPEFAAPSDLERWDLSLLEQSDDHTGLLLQRWSRWRDQQGVESLCGELLIEFQPGLKTRSVHIPWQPPFSGAIHATAEVIEGGDISVEVDLVRPYGMRLIARRSATEDQPAACRVEFFIAQPDIARAAA